MTSLPLIQTVHLFRELDDCLLALLRGLTPDDWNRPTVCSRWCVKDIASHLLDGNIRRLSSQRDGYVPPGAPSGFGSDVELVAYLNRLNADWTQATRRISPPVLIELLATTGSVVIDMFERADPMAAALFAVSWAGESQSTMWFDIAREYTERWHHQRQIADAVAKSTPIDSPRLYHPVLETFLRALPFTYRSVSAPDGTLVAIKIDGPAGGEWFLRRESDTWCLLQAAEGLANASVMISQDVAWKLFTKRMHRQMALQRFPAIQIHGDVDLGGRVLEMVSIMA